MGIDVATIRLTRMCGNQYTAEAITIFLLYIIQTGFGRTRRPQVKMKSISPYLTIIPRNYVVVQIGSNWSLKDA